MVRALYVATFFGAVVSLALIEPPWGIMIGAIMVAAHGQLGRIDGEEQTYRKMKRRPKL